MSLKPGDIAVIKEPPGEWSKWSGLRVKVLNVISRYDGDGVDNVYVQPLSDRPDGHGRKEFYWTEPELIKE